MNQYFLGIDIGATKSHALLADAEGRVVGFGLTGPGNHEVVGYDGLANALQTITEQALSMAGVRREQIAGAGFGVAGYDWPSELEPTLEVIRPLGLAASLAVVNDTVIGLVAGATEGWGIAVVAGTSNNCCGRDRHGREGRVTGCGPWMGEYGGAGELVARALQMVAMAWTKRGPATRLTEAFVELTGAQDAADFLEGLVLERFHLDATAAPLVFRVAAAGDPVAIGVIRWTGEELASLVNGVVRQLNFESIDFEVVLVGSLYDGGRLLTEPMRRAIHQTAPGARLIRLAAPPVTGGVLLGMEKAGIKPEQVRERLLQSMTNFIKKNDKNQSSALVDHHQANDRHS